MKSEILVVQCCQCSRIQVNNKWVKKPVFLSQDMEYTHAYCPSCLSLVIKEVEAYISAGVNAASKKYPLVTAGMG
jgi:hypothetical protein